MTTSSLPVWLISLLGLVNLPAGLVHNLPSGYGLLPFLVWFISRSDLVYLPSGFGLSPFRVWFISLPGLVNLHSRC